ncbi:MAG TPA: DNA repair protein RecO [Gammaproteobacteria bacterium]|nr:DNA repair protein RecO [Gammaproteobacteria bacterium]
MECMLELSGTIPAHYSLFTIHYSLMQVSSQIAYILHKRDYRETSSIIDVLTKDYGRVSLMVRGGRGPKSRIAANLLLFTPLVVSWQGRGSLPYVKSIERAELKAPQLKSRALLSAMYINELLTYLLHSHDEQAAVFEHYHHCLYALQDPLQLEITLRRFELKLLELLGFGLNLVSEADSAELIAADARYRYHPEHGPVRIREATASTRLPEISGACLQALAAESYDLLSQNPRYMAELKSLMRFVIAHHLGNKTLKSRDLFRPLVAS